MTRLHDKTPDRTAASAAPCGVRRLATPSSSPGS